MKAFCIRGLQLILRIVYGVLKLLPTKQSKVVFLSRQADEMPLDFRLLERSLLQAQPYMTIASVCCRFEGEKGGGKGRFVLATLKSLYHLATSRVCVLDAYWPAVSLLHHKASLTVIQLWHALGKIKQSGYQTLDRPGGRSSEMAALMHMHENYDYIIAGGKAWNPCYCASFRTTEDKLVNCGLPRIDYLLQTAEENRATVLDAYPAFRGKTVILYAPTFRRGMGESAWTALPDAFEVINAREPGRDGKGQYVLIVKGHPNEELEIGARPGVYDCPEFSAMDLLAACDYLITDYSAIALEGAVLRRPTWYYVYDYEEYSEKNGLNIDLFTAMPGCVFPDAEALMERLASADRAARTDEVSRDAMPYPYMALNAYRKAYLPRKLGTSTAQITTLILRQMLPPHPESVPVPGGPA